MELNTLSAISPIDGRYRNRTELLSEYYSEYALIRYRIKVEVEYFIALCEIPIPQLQSFDKSKYDLLRDLYRNFTVESAERVKSIEEEINHDVKAVEYFLKETFRKIGVDAKICEFVHFALTSQDINNTAIPLSNREAIEQIYMPYFDDMLLRINSFAHAWATVPMLSRTHGQPASPTRLGKEFAVFAERLEVQRAQLVNIPFSAKFGGATGNFNAHHVSFPDVKWKKFADDFISDLGLKRSQTTTQIEHYDNFAAQYDAMKRINNILIDLCRDVWTYILQDYFKQKIDKAEVGSSTMPHKINPIDFENAEGNFGIANAMFSYMSSKLPISRLQRDLTDSTVLRNIGVPMAHTIIAFQAMIKGMDKLIANYTAMDADLTRNWMVVGEGIQTILRREGFPKPFETLKELTRKSSEESIDKVKLNEFIDQLDLPKQVKDELKHITPFNYTGI